MWGDGDVSPPSIILIGSNRLKYDVILDGQISSADEWSDTFYVDMLWGLCIPPGSPYINARVWAKNDDTWLYLLYRVEWPSEDVADYDGAQIAYFWGEYVPPWDYSDLGYLNYLGESWDAYGWDDFRWYSDEDAAPPGDNNVEGAAFHDGTYYWFEFKKELSSGDGYDWSFEPGRTYSLLVGLWDSSLEKEYHENVQLSIAP